MQNLGSCDLKLLYKLFKNKLNPCKKCQKEQINIRVTDLKSFIEKANITQEQLNLQNIII
jgi:archaellum component FlaC